MKPLLKQYFFFLAKRYFSFFGKASRKQYWLRTLVFLTGSTLLIVLFKKTSMGGWEVLLGITWFGTWLWVLFVASIRRCRDVGINPHWVWLWLFPGVGSVFYIVLGCLKPDRPTPRMAKEGLVRYFSVFGYATRQEYWLRTLVFLTGSTLLIVLFRKTSLGVWEVLLGITWFGPWLWVLFALGARRCRDVGINPHWVWLWLFPGVGSVFYIVLGCLKPDDGVRIARPTPKARMAKEGLVRYFSIYGYATRQEYWCVLLPITTALTFASLIFLLVISLAISSLFSSIENYLLAYILHIFLATNWWAIAWLSTAAIVRRCRDAAINLKWSIALLLPLWLYQIFWLPLGPMSPGRMTLEQQSPFSLSLTRNLDDFNISLSSLPFPLYILLLCFLFLCFLSLVFSFVPYIVFGSLTSKEKA